jgi:hypothetical protein
MKKVGPEVGPEGPEMTKTLVYLNEDAFEVDREELQSSVDENDAIAVSEWVEQHGRLVQPDSVKSGRERLGGTF